MSETHEDFGREAGRQGPSDRNFGLVMAAAFLVIGLLPLRHHNPVRGWSLILSAAVFLISLARPAWLHLANRIWTKIGLLLGKVLNPVVTALLFFLVFTPAAMILRRMGKDLLALRFDRDAGTYWNERSASPSSMADQF